MFFRFAEHPENAIFGLGKDLISRWKKETNILSQNAAA